MRGYRVGTGGRIHPETACGDWLGVKKCDLSFNLPPGFYPPSQPSITSHLKIKFRAFVIQCQQRIRKSRTVWLFRVQRGTWMCNCSVYRLKNFFSAAFLVLSKIQVSLGLQPSGILQSAGVLFCLHWCEFAFYLDHLLVIFFLFFLYPCGLVSCCDHYHHNCIHNYHVSEICEER